MKEKEGLEEEEDGEPQPKPKTKKPDSAEMVSVKLRGQEIQIPKALAPIIQALQQDHLEATRKITEQGQELAGLRKESGKPAADPEKAEAARQKALEKYDAELWETIDSKDGKGLSASLLKLTSAQFGGLIEEQAGVIETLRAELEQVKGAVYQGMGDQLATNNMRKALPGDLALMGHKADALTVEQVKPVFDALWAEAPQGASPREVYLIAIGKALAAPKKPGPKPGKSEKPTTVDDEDNTPLDFSRAAAPAPNRKAPTSNGRASGTPTKPAQPLFGSRFSESL